MRSARIPVSYTRSKSMSAFGYSDTAVSDDRASVIPESTGTIALTPGGLLSRSSKMLHCHSIIQLTRMGVQKRGPDSQRRRRNDLPADTRIDYDPRREFLQCRDGLWCVHIQAGDVYQRQCRPIAGLVRFRVSAGLASISPFQIWACPSTARLRFGVTKQQTARGVRPKWTMA